MPDLMIQIKKKTDGSAALSCRTASQCNATAATYYAQHGLSGACVLTDGDLRRIRENMRDLFAQWAALPAGETLALRFTRPGPAV